ncbi:MAG: redoxin domain-containing protein [Melioribacter sp.]|nr:redoxin domain-containing protein [Melioribacter sp.]
MFRLNNSILTVLFFIASFAFAQIQPAMLDRPMTNFTMPTYDGKTVSLSDFKGKNVLIVFPRGYAAENRWCSICNYQYAQMLDLDKKIKGKTDLQILYVFPYSEEKAHEWIDAFPDQMALIESMKNPKDDSEQSMRRAAFAKNYFTEKYEFTKGDVPTPFPILIDSARTVSKSLGLFMAEWGGSKVDQNIPAVFLLDKNGVLKFKYVGQSTADRPGVDYLLKVIEKLL